MAVSQGAGATGAVAATSGHRWRRSRSKTASRGMISRARRAFWAEGRTTSRWTGSRGQTMSLSSMRQRTIDLHKRGYRREGRNKYIRTVPITEYIMHNKKDDTLVEFVSSETNDGAGSHLSMYVLYQGVCLSFRLQCMSTIQISSLSYEQDIFYSVLYVQSRACSIAMQTRKCFNRPVNCKVDPFYQILARPLIHVLSVQYMHAYMQVRPFESNHHAPRRC